MNFTVVVFFLFSNAPYIGTLFEFPLNYQQFSHDHFSKLSALETVANAVFQVKWLI